MKKLIISLLLLASLFWLASQTVEAASIEAGHSAMPANLSAQDDYQAQSESDYRTQVLATFLRKYNSPLSPFAAHFVEAADTYGLDWKLVPAITGVESTFGKQIPYNSYNAYGWANGAYKFNSWEESIWHVNRVLREKYVDRGVTTVNQIARIYAPPSSTWAGKVAFFMRKIETEENFAFNL